MKMKSLFIFLTLRLIHIIFAYDRRKVDVNCQLAIDDDMALLNRVESDLKGGIFQMDQRACALCFRSKGDFWFNHKDEVCCDDKLCVPRHRNRLEYNRILNKFTGECFPKTVVIRSDGVTGNPGTSGAIPKSSSKLMFDSGATSICRNKNSFDRKISALVRTHGQFSPMEASRLCFELNGNKEVFRSFNKNSCVEITRLLALNTDLRLICPRIPIGDMSVTKDANGNSQFVSTSAKELFNACADQCGRVAEAVNAICRSPSAIKPLLIDNSEASIIGQSCGVGKVLTRSLRYVDVQSIMRQISSLTSPIIVGVVSGFSISNPPIPDHYISILEEFEDFYTFWDPDSGVSSLNGEQGYGRIFKSTMSTSRNQLECVCSDGLCNGHQSDSNKHYRLYNIN